MYGVADKLYNSLKEELVRVVPLGRRIAYIIDVVEVVYKEVDVLA